MLRSASSRTRVARMLSTSTPHCMRNWTVNIVPGSVSIVSAGSPAPDEYRVALPESADEPGKQPEVLFGRTPMTELLHIVQRSSKDLASTENYLVLQHPSGDVARLPSSTSPSHAQLHAEQEAGFSGGTSQPAESGWDEAPHVMAHLVGCRVALVTASGAVPMNGGEPLQPTGAAARHILTSAYAYVAGGAAAAAALVWFML